MLKFRVFMIELPKRKVYRVGIDNNFKHLKPIASRYCSFWPVTYCCQPYGFKTRLLWRGSSPTSISASHRPVTGSNII